jgi:hypothetical protein
VIRVGREHVAVVKSIISGQLKTIIFWFSSGGRGGLGGGGRLFVLRL